MIPVHDGSDVPMAHLQMYFRDCVKTAPYIISVGCGRARTEVWLLNVVPKETRKRLILVDPDPSSFSKGEPFLPIDYPTVTDLVAKQPQVVGQCLLLLLWPSPDFYTTYDFDAVIDLKPKSILVLHERPPKATNGHSGGHKMHAFLHEPEKWDYRLICETMYRFEMVHEFCREWSLLQGHGSYDCPRITWLAKKGSRVPKNRECHSVQKLADNISKKAEQ